TNIDFFNSMEVVSGMLYIGTREGGAAEVYRYNPSAGVTGTSVFTRVNSTAGNICGTGSVSEVADMVLYNNQLYAGTYFGGSAEICRYDGGTSWTRVNHANAGSI